MGWRREKVDVLPWLDKYATRRYGSWTPNVHEAWRLLISGAYSNYWGSYTRSYVVERPRTSLEPDTRFRPGDVFQAWKVLVTEVLNKNLDSSIEPLKYDLVDFGRQVLVNLFADVYALHRATFNQLRENRLSSLASDLNIISALMLEIIDDVDALLASNTNFLFGHWLSDAIASAASNTSQDFLNLIHFNARNQITRWGPIGNIEDYAAKEWAGLISTYYKKRWEIYLTWVSNITENGAAYNTSYLNEPLDLFENGYSYQTDMFPVTPVGDSLELTAKHLKKYAITDPHYIESHYTVSYDTELTPEDLLYGQPVSLWTDNYEQLVWLCETNPDCGGFSYPPVSFKSTSKAQLRMKGNDTASWTQFKSGSIAFVKKALEAKKLRLS